MWSNQDLWNVRYHELVIIARLGKKRKLQVMVVQFIIDHRRVPVGRSSRLQIVDFVSLIVIPR